MIGSDSNKKKGGFVIFYFPAALSSTATLLWLLRCYLAQLKAEKAYLKI